MKHHLIATLCVLSAAATPAMAEVEVSVYGGFQAETSSDVDIRGDDVVADRDLDIDWEAKPFTAPPYYGIRVTKWQTPTLGYGLDFTHNKVYPKDGELPADIDRLEFTDGLNTLTANAYFRFDPLDNGLTPYVGGGLGISVPHVELESGTSRTHEFQVTGPAVALIAGASFPIDDQWSVFGEYKGTYTSNEGDLDTGGTVESDIFTNAINVGVSFNF